MSRCEIFSQKGRDSIEYEKMFNKVRGEIASMKRLHPKLATNLMRRIEKIQPEKSNSPVE